MTEVTYRNLLELLYNQLEDGSASKDAEMLIDILETACPDEESFKYELRGALNLLEVVKMHYLIVSILKNKSR